jgi:hypothetical protein
VRAVIAFATLGSVALAACGSSSPVEVLIKPGITAIEQSSALACDADLMTLQTAIESFTVLNVDPPAIESDLVPDWLRSESTLYDLVDGAIVPAAGSGCPAVLAGATGAPAGTTPPEEPANLRECTVIFKTLSVAIEAYYAMNGEATTVTEQALVDGDLLRALNDAYDVDAGGQLVAVPGGICGGIEVALNTTSTSSPSPAPLPADVGECEQQLKLLEVAMEAYFAQTGAVALTESDLVPDLLRQEASGYDIVDGAIAAAPGSICPPS